MAAMVRGRDGFSTWELGTKSWFLFWKRRFERFFHKVVWSKAALEGWKVWFPGG
jgi:hypothetical protein